MALSRRQHVPSLDDDRRRASKLPSNLGGGRQSFDSAFVDAAQMAPHADTCEVLVLVTAAHRTKLQVVRSQIASRAQRTSTNVTVARVDMPVFHIRLVDRVSPNHMEGHTQESEQASPRGSAVRRSLPDIWLRSSRALTANGSARGSPDPLPDIWLDPANALAALSRAAANARSCSSLGGIGSRLPP